MARDFFGGLVILAFAGLYYASTLDIQRSSLADNLGAQGMPEAYAAALAILALLLVLRSGYGWLTSGPAVSVNADTAKADLSKVDVSKVDLAEDKPSLRRSIVRMLGMLAIGVGYIIAIPWLGYAATVALMIGAVVLYQGGRPSIATLLTAVIGAAFFWFLFVMVLQIPLPAGVWGDLF